MILDFDLMCLTPFHFIMQLFASGVIFSCDTKQNQKDLTERTFLKIKEYSLYFAECVNEYYNIIQLFPSSMIAAACIYFARKCCNLEKSWNESLEDYT